LSGFIFSFRQTETAKALAAELFDDEDEIVRRPALNRTRIPAAFCLSAVCLDLLCLYAAAPSYTATTALPSRTPPLLCAPARCCVRWAARKLGAFGKSPPRGLPSAVCAVLSESHRRNPQVRMDMSGAGRDLCGDRVPTMRLEFSGPPSHKGLEFSIQTPETRFSYIQTIVLRRPHLDRGAARGQSTWSSTRWRGSSARRLAVRAHSGCLSNLSVPHSKSRSKSLDLNP
jgi:hypothetical protein